MHSISISSSGGLQATTSEKPSPAAPIESLSRDSRVQTTSSTRNNVFRNNAKEAYLARYRGFFGSVSIQCKSEISRGSTTRRSEFRETTNEKIVTITPNFLRKTFELRFLNHLGRISRTLSTYPILKNDAPIFNICSNGDLQSLQMALSNGNVSPFAMDEEGWSLLHVSPLPSQQS